MSLLWEVPGQVGDEAVVAAVADGGEAAQLALGDDLDEVVADGLEVLGAFGQSSSSQLARLSEGQPTAGPSHQDGLMLDLGTRNGVDLEATEQGFGVECSGFRPEWLRSCGACTPGAVCR